MKTIKTVEIRPEYVINIPAELEENVIYISKEYSGSAHNCLCGCKSRIFLPINQPDHSFELFRTYGWNLIENQKGISFTPSIGNYNLPCKSHYIITNNKANFV